MERPREVPDDQLTHLPGDQPPRSANRGATRTAVILLGLLAAFNGADHGVGAITQGPGAPPGLVYESWAHVDAFDPLDGEPALTLTPTSWWARSPATRPVGSATRLGARLWPWPLGVAAACFLGLVPGTAALDVADVASDALISALTAGAFTATGLTAWSALARDRAVAAPEPSSTSAHQSSDEKEAQP